ncbi:MAG: isoprenyl transferase [Lachnospiraceae bacterium]|nr:isoprenyl transferase [Lachnospiraceae bacterium]
MKIPKHVSIIMDGNGRWAKALGKPRTYGHKVGAENLVQLVEDADEIGIKYLTVYAFSTENWNRPDMEVKTLMRLFRKYLKICYQKAMKNHSRIRLIGDFSKLDSELQEMIRVLEHDTKDFEGINFTIALNYGSRDEMLRGMKKMLADCKEGRLNGEDLDEELFSSYLDTSDIPDPDLMIRTSGEERLSNWMMWQHAYSEFYFTDTAWPDFHKEELLEAVKAYTLRDRRYGKVSSGEEPNV